MPNNVMSESIEDAVKIDLTGCVGVNWIHLAEDGVYWFAFVLTMMKLQIP
jgi:hypothetical protein